MVDGVALRHRRNAPRRGRARRRHGRAAVDAPRRTKASAASRRRASSRAAASPTGPTAATKPDSLRHARLSAGRARREDRRAGPGVRQERHRRSQARRRSGDRSRQGRDRPARHAGRREERRHRRRRAPAGQRRRRAGRTTKATSAASTSGPASGCGSSTPFRSPASSATTRGKSDSWVYTGNTGVWAQISVDEELGLVYLPVELPTGDYYGGHRPGNGLFGESLVAVDLQDRQAQVALPVGAPRHLGLGHPVRADPREHHGQRTADQGARAADEAGLAVHVRPRHRQPIWPIEERPVEKGDVPGEWYSPTQPFPTKPPAFDRQGVSLDDLIDFTPELKAEGQKMAARLQDRADLHAADGQQMGRPARHAAAPVGHRRRQLAGRLVRSRDAASSISISVTSISAQLGLMPTTSKRSDMNYISGQAPDPSAPPRPAAVGRRRRRRESDGAGPAARQTALRTHHGPRHEQGRDGLAGRARRHRRRGEKSIQRSKASPSRAPDARAASARWSPSRW